MGKAKAKAKGRPRKDAVNVAPKVDAPKQMEAPKVPAPKAAAPAAKKKPDSKVSSPIQKNKIDMSKVFTPNAEDLGIADELGDINFNMSKIFDTTVKKSGGKGKSKVFDTSDKKNADALAPKNM